MGASDDSGKRPKISVIIPTYNRNAELKNTLIQLLAQDDPAEEIIVVDQTVTHEPEVETFLRALEQEGKIRLLLQNPPSLPGARNRGIVECCQEVILFVDDDVVIKPDFVRNHRLSYAQSDIDGVAGAMLHPQYPEFTDVIAPHVFSDPWGWMDFPCNYSKRSKAIFMIGCNFSVKRSFALRVGGFDKNFVWPSVGEDSDFSWRLHKVGANVVYNPDCVVYNSSPPYGGCYFNRTAPIVTRALVNTLYYYFVTVPCKDSVVTWCKLLRKWVLNRKNLLNPWFFLVSISKFIVFTLWAVALTLKGRDLIPQKSLARADG